MLKQSAAARAVAMPFATLFAILLAAPTAPAAEVAGVRMADTLSVEDATLTLNGMGIRKKFFIKVYVGALYLPGRNSSARAILDADAPRAITIEFLRDVGKEKIRDAYRDGFVSNAPEQARRQQANINRMLALVPDARKGDRILYTYYPAKGSTITMPGSTQASFEGKEFADAYLLLYLGPDPADEDLKKALLGM